MNKFYYIVKNNLLLIILLLIAVFSLLYKINKPFIGHHDWNGAFWGTITRNYMNGQFSYFSHYTLLLPILFTFSSLIFGLSETTMRLTTVFFSILMLVYIYKIGNFLYSKTVGILAVALTIVTPMFLYFGKLPDHEPIITSLITITFYAYLKIIPKNKKFYFLFLLLLILTLFESWSGFFLIPVLIIHSYITKKTKVIRPLKLIIVAISVLLIHLVLTVYFNGIGGLRGFLDVGLFRLNFQSANQNKELFTFQQFIDTETHYGVIYFTRLLLGLSFVWLIKFFWELFRKKLNTTNINLSVLFIYAILFIFTFKNLAYIHDYKLYLLLPFISLSGAVILNQVVYYTFDTLKFPSQLKIVIFILFITVIGLERMNYLNTLLNSSFNTPGYQLGKTISENIQSDKKILVNSYEFGAYYEVFVDYYAKRGILFRDLTKKTFFEGEYEKNYDFIVFIENRPSDSELRDFLMKNYNWEKYQEFQFFDLSKRLN